MFFVNTITGGSLVFRQVQKSHVVVQRLMVLLPGFGVSLPRAWGKDNGSNPTNDDINFCMDYEKGIQER